MSGGNGGHTRDFAEVAAGESAWLAVRRAASGLPAPDGDLAAVALSGGGVRSACFSLGVLEALQRAGLMRHVDLLSTVSGGGYTGATYSWLRATAGSAAEDPFAARVDGERATVLDWLRAHGRYLVTHRGYSLWTLAASILAATLLNLLVLGPPLLLSLAGLTLDWLPLQWPQWLRMPHVPVPPQHDGFVLLLIGGVACAALFPLFALAFALAAGVARWRSMPVVLGLRIAMGRLLLASALLLGLGLIPLATVAGEALLRQLHDGALPLAAHASWAGSLLSGLAALLVGRDAHGAWRARIGMLGLALVVAALLMLGYHLAVHAELVRSAGFAAAFALALALACACDVNEVSMHAYYRARLAEAFLPRVAGARAPDPAGFTLDAIGPGRGAPLPLLNTTLNTVSARSRKESARGGESFTFSPLYAGSAATGWRPVGEYRSVMSLSAAATISGAAVDPDTYATRGRAVSILMALLNVRLGIWALNPAAPPRQPRTRPWWWLFLLREMFGVGLDAQRRHVHLSDGGHFDNLGLYELVRRRVRFALVCDAGADPDLLLWDLGRVVERVRVDFGAEVSLCADALRTGDSREAARPWLLGQVRYEDGSSGEILYLKALRMPGLPADVEAYARAHPLFPDESTANQFFDEPQFEAYRVLGRSLVERLIAEGGPAPADFAALFGRLRVPAAAPAVA